MDNQTATSEAVSEEVEHALIRGDLSGLTEAQRLQYYHAVCKSLGLNPLTLPFSYLTLNGKLRLYALRDCTDQLRRLHGISIYITNRERMGDIYIVTARAKDRTGREDESTGAVPLGNLKGDALANALMKSETKAKRRVTLSIAGLGWLDESELDTIPSAAAENVRSSAAVAPHPLPAGEEHAQSPAEQHPTADEITTLIDTARAANVSLEDFGHDMRRLMQLTDGQKITKKFLRETMTMDQYNLARKEYGERLRVILEEDVPNHEPPEEVLDGSITTPTTSPEPTVETTEPAMEDPKLPDKTKHSDRYSSTEPAMEDPKPPFDGESSSAGSASPEVDAAERDRQRLRQEIASWDLRVKPEEIEHVIQHHPYSKARALLWQARRQPEPALAS